MNEFQIPSKFQSQRHLDDLSSCQLSTVPNTSILSLTPIAPLGGFKNPSLYVIENLIFLHAYYSLS